MTQIPYDRQSVYEYAKEWALKRNPGYLNFETLGGDCTNFASQCIYAGCRQMNFTQLYGWFYLTSSNRTPSWTGVEFLHDFLIRNQGIGPYAEVIPVKQAQIGDIIQLGNAQRFYHSPIVVGKDGDEIYVAAHSVDVFMRPLSDYEYIRARCLHILGARKA